MTSLLAIPIGCELSSFIDNNKESELPWINLQEFGMPLVGVFLSLRLRC